MPEGFVSIRGRDGDFAAYFVPAAVTPSPGVVILQEIYGINPFMRHACRLFAAAGFSALCPDLFWRQEPGVSLTDGSKEELDRAFAFAAGFDLDKGVADIHAALDHLRGMRECTGRVGAVGYCLGGLLAYLTMCRTDALCAIGYYGVDIEKRLDEAGKMRRPLMLHVADADSTMTPEAIAALSNGMKGRSLVTVHHYPGMDHAFARHGTRYFKYDENAADLANRRSVEFLKAYLA